MPKRIKLALVALAAVFILALTFATGCFVSYNFTSNTQASGIDTIDQAWNIIFRDYVDKDKLNPSAFTESAIKSMMETLNDPHSAYLSPQEYKISASSFEKSFQGIGAQVGMKDKQVIIIAPIEGSPAEKAGIKPGDAILAVDGQSTKDLSLNETVLKVRGPKGTAVKLLILHENEKEPVEITIIRAEIESVSVRSQMRENLGYIRISQFAENTDNELVKALESIIQQGAKGIILDLRSNPGGMLTTVVDNASHFLKGGIVLTTVDNQGNKHVYDVKQNGIVTDLPMVVLVNEYSASGSEVLAGALQDTKRAAIAGVKTFGKGSVNILRPLNDGSGIYITTGRWLTPNGNLIEGKGITPDYEVKLTGEEGIQWAIDFLKKR